ncbi:MAG: hypothetical protein AB1646_05105 [Thermodesulfobacteriota bacterium]
MSKGIKLLRWLRYLNPGSWGSPGPTGHWTSPHKRPRYTDEEVDRMVACGLLVVEGGSGLSRDDPVILRKVPGVLAGREISVILSQKLVGQPSAEWQNHEIAFLPVEQTDPPRFRYGVLVTMSDGSRKEAWYEVYHLPMRTGQGQ